MKTLLSILKGIKNGLSTAFRKVKSSKRLQGALVLVCIVAVACGALFAAYKKGTKVNQTIQNQLFVTRILKRLHSKKQQLKRLDLFINR